MGGAAFRSLGKMFGVKKTEEKRKKPSIRLKQAVKTQEEAEKKLSSIPKRTKHKLLERSNGDI